MAHVRRSAVPDADLAIYDPNDYSAARALGARLREQLPGITYDSVRHHGGTCVGAFVPRIISDVRLESILELVWNGTAFVERKDVHPL